MKEAVKFIVKWTLIIVVVLFVFRPFSLSKEELQYLCVWGGLTYFFYLTIKEIEKVRNDIRGLREDIGNWRKWRD